METFTVIAVIIALVFGVLEIILFFKLWRMCDDVRSIASSFCAKEVPAAPAKELWLPGVGGTFGVGELVVVKATEEQFRIKDEIIGNDGKFQYLSEKHGKYFHEDEIEDFDRYWAAKKGNKA